MNSTKMKDTLNAADRAAHHAASNAAHLAAATTAAAAGALQDAADLGRGAVRDLKSGASDAMDQAEDSYDDLRDAANSTIETIRATLANSGDRLAETLRGAADSSHGPTQRRFDVLTDGAANGVADLSDRLRGNSVTDLMHSTQAYARRNPGAFAAGAAVAGFALARFLHASARKGPRG
jgi:uncharacterized protein YukE